MGDAGGGRLVVLTCRGVSFEEQDRKASADASDDERHDEDKGD